MNDKNDQKNNELDRIEEDLLREEEKSKKSEMPVSGKSVFEIQRLKQEKGIDKKK
jgi:hypothetical protein